MTLSQWDESVGPYLRILERRSGWAQQDAKNISDDIAVMASAIDRLPCRPEWETLAISALIGAERALLEALEKVRAIKEQYADLPSEEKYHAQA